MVARNARVLDIGCGTGELLTLLEREKNVDGRGIELSQSGVNVSVAKGLSVVQGDADHDLKDYPDKAFDYAILSQTLQATRRPKQVLEDLLRVAEHVIVSFPNFGHWKVRLQLLFRGRMPETYHLPEPWYETQNIHLCTIRDFLMLCRAIDARIEKRYALNEHGRALPVWLPDSLHNSLGQQGVFLLTKR
jgi:methionine biosynthesis protein MetW